MEMLKAGVHFGHQTSKRHPKMSTYIFTKRSGVSIVDLEQTRVKLEEALNFVEQITSNGGVILFLGTKKQARDVVKKAAVSSASPYVVGRWIGGTFTNFDQVSGLVKKLKELCKDEETGDWKKYTKKEQVSFRKEQHKLEEFVGGMRDMGKLPKAIFIVDIKKEKTAVAEANNKGIPIIAMVDTNVNPDLVQYPIPANDDAIRSVEMISDLIAQTIIQSRKVS